MSSEEVEQLRAQQAEMQNRTERAEAYVKLLLDNSSSSQRLLFKQQIQGYVAISPKPYPNPGSLWRWVEEGCPISFHEVKSLKCDSNFTFVLFADGEVSTLKVMLESPAWECYYRG